MVKFSVRGLIETFRIFQGEPTEILQMIGFLNQNGLLYWKLRTFIYPAYLQRTHDKPFYDKIIPLNNDYDSLWWQSHKENIIIVTDYFLLSVHRWLDSIIQNHRCELSGWGLCFCERRHTVIPQVPNTGPELRPVSSNTPDPVWLVQEVIAFFFLITPNIKNIVSDWILLT